MAGGEVEVDRAAEWCRERPDDATYRAAVDTLLRDGLRREVRLALLPGEPGREGLWAIAIQGESPLKHPGLPQHTLHVSLAYESELCKDLQAQLTAKWGDPRMVTLRFHRFGSGASGELRLTSCPVGGCELVQAAHAAGHYWYRALHVSF
jgi:hypothetical protein